MEKVGTVLHTKTLQNIFTRCDSGHLIKVCGKVRRGIVSKHISDLRNIFLLSIKQPAGFADTGISYVAEKGVPLPERI